MTENKIDVTESANGGSESSARSSVREVGRSEPNQRKKKGMVLPFQPHSISFNEVKYSVDMPQVGFFCTSIVGKSLFYRLN